MVRRFFFGSNSAQVASDGESPSPGNLSTTESTGSTSSAPISPPRMPPSRQPSLEESRRLLFPQALPDDIQEPLMQAFGALRFVSEGGDSSHPVVDGRTAPSSRRMAPQLGIRSDEPLLSCSRSAPAEAPTVSAQTQSRRSSLTSVHCRERSPVDDRLRDWPWLPSSKHRATHLDRLEGPTSESFGESRDSHRRCSTDSDRECVEDISFSGSRKRLRARPRQAFRGDAAPKEGLRDEKDAGSKNRAAGCTDRTSGVCSPADACLPGARSRRVGGFIGFLLSVLRPSEPSPPPPAALPAAGEDRDRAGSAPSSQALFPFHGSGSSSSCPAPDRPPFMSCLHGGSPAGAFEAPEEARSGVGFGSQTESPVSPEHSARPFFPRSPQLTTAFADARFPVAGAWPRRAFTHPGGGVSFAGPVKTLAHADPQPCAPHHSLSPWPSAVSVYTRTAQLADAGQRVLRLLWSGCWVGAFLWLLLHLVFSLYRDIQQGEEQRQLRTAAEAAFCRQQHRENGCDTLDPLPPYLQQPCSEWKNCLMRQPQHHGERTKIVAAVVGDVLNAFFQRLEWRTIACLGLLLIALIYATSWLTQPTAPPLIPPSADAGDARRGQQHSQPAASYSLLAPPALPAPPHEPEMLQAWRARPEVDERLAAQHGSLLKAGRLSGGDSGAEAPRNVPCGGASACFPGEEMRDSEWRLLSGWDQPRQKREETEPLH
ncbi:hypothetical protein BESB_011430 [Besnoitia besnoiti]|uniref:Brl1/Brr6 domain-containing protein n=1 Tax=Besnoitia besnoiti TaxID=94643 RepID=A0A2A9MIP6_BESBE|nr:hypothetical protein BESB_011430 [Besnoitia besnoiti]PFH37855.1 hypothetical protein BESB_011430 [Besnoitia besnoiti]